MHPKGQMYNFLSLFVSMNVKINYNIISFTFFSRLGFRLSTKIAHRWDDLWDVWKSLGEMSIKMMKQDFYK